jgi:lipopolysaccharide transport system ATP-binding protein
MSSEAPAISVRNLSKCFHIYENPLHRLQQFVLPQFDRWLGRDPRSYFREFWALKDVSLEIRKGETVGIIGRNGSGKSTLLQLICGTLAPTAGTVEINGRVAALLELGSGFNPEFTGRENVYLNAAMLGLTTAEIDASFDDIAAFADIGDFINQPVKTYSSGMYVRLAFAVIAHVRADILVIDEALSVGDVFFVQKCMRFLRKFMERGTILFVSHDTGAVLSLCRRAFWLDQGAVKAGGLPKDIIAQYLEKQYEAQQGASQVPVVKAAGPLTAPEKNLRDMRLDYFNQTPYRNDIQLFAFAEDGAGFGKGGATITSVLLMDDGDRPLGWIVGGEPVTVVVRCQAHQPLFGPIVGFNINNRLGQIVFGDNTHCTYVGQPLSIAAGVHFEARFSFVMPTLPVGDYTVTAAVAEGTQLEHVQHHWLHAALSFRVHSSSVCFGAIGVPMAKITLAECP